MLTDAQTPSLGTPIVPLGKLNITACLKLAVRAMTD